MRKSTQIKEIQKRLDKINISFKDETSFDFTEDEYLSILCWIKHFKNHYKVFEKEKYPEINYPIVSKRLRLDFVSYLTAIDGTHNIYLFESGSALDDKGKKKMQSVKDIIRIWQL